MPKLNIVQDGRNIKLEYDVKVANGIFIVGENKTVKRNCKALKIELGEDTHEYELKQKVTKLKKTGVLTTRLINQHQQYVIKDYAEPANFDAFLSEVHEASREPLRAAYTAKNPPLMLKECI